MTSNRANRRPHPTPAILALLATLAAALLLAACGSSTPSASPSSSRSPADAALAFSKCMREHGVKDFPNPEVSGGGAVKLQYRSRAGAGANQQTMEAAQNACKHFQAALAPKLTPQQKVEQEEAVLKFARCMREHGVEVHASTAEGAVRIGIHRGPGSSGPNPESPAFQAAQSACQKLLPFKGHGGPGGPATSHSGADASPREGSSGRGAGMSLSTGG